MRLHVLAAIVCATGCYSGSTAARDVNGMWRGHARVELEARIGTPRVEARPDGTSVLRWIRRGHHITLPSGSFDLNVTNASFDLRAEARPGSIDKYEYVHATALIDPQGTVLQLDSAVMAAGIPDGANVRTGALFGFTAAAGAVTNATSPMPSLGLYLGGMIGPRLGLVGTYQFVTGKGEAGYAMGHAWGMALQHWATARLSVRAGAAMVLDLEPGLEDPGIAPGATGALSYALVRSGSFVLDARFDATIATSSAFGMFGIGVNVN